ncbi:NmrA-like family protein [Pseudoalteromonas sp. THAF3]|uniref:SDR family oxidoreductase n=1 Tax=Pseudoalteromonas sp. THAF3 TaxID=2587843 RepID=UPI001267B73D|nr:SDR family oxidoreductase [Pseudoalteromonas sp. THAF3]QFU04826.1 NmrA-like family protein [Pseudoalteromonas sp. THAF3]
MENVVILGASGQIASWVVVMLANIDDIRMRLVVRDASKLQGELPNNADVVTADVLNQSQLEAALAGADIVYANLFGDMAAMAKSVVGAMEKLHISRLIFVNSLGIYNELPGEFGKWNDREIGQYLGTYREAADIIESSKLDYSILRAAWLTDNDEVDFETTERNEVFKGTEVSRKSVATLITDIILQPDTYSKRNIGVNKPNTDGDKPAFM